MFRIEISPDTADALVKDILIEDYYITKKLYKRLEDRTYNNEELTSAEYADMRVYETTIVGFETVLNYYLDRETYLTVTGKDGG